MSGVRVRELQRISQRELDGLCAVLMDCVAGGASVNFMWPLTREKAEKFWRGVDEGLARGDRALIVAEDEAEHIVGTAQVVWAPQENQPHRADVAKMLVHRRARRLGIGGLLLAAAERAAKAAGKTLLVLDTASEDAERLYERGGWQRVGAIPRYALMPDGPFCRTVVFYKDLDNSPRATESRT
ncbi:MAG TPA: GNAT family N-acetyltransferase [Steroidobacteraceae bacterium]|nr:GNAT family N-acetyltransferase [Steroidobacteraceae bacterium]